MADRLLLEEGWENDEEKCYHIEKMWDHHHAIIRLLVASNGLYTNKQIADMVGCTDQTVSNVRNSSLGKARLAQLHKQADDEAIALGKRIMETAPLAVEMLEKQINDGLESDREEKEVRSQAVRASLGILDHAHPKTLKKQELHAHVTLEQLNEIKERHRAAKAEEAQITEAEVITDPEEDESE